MGAEIDRLEIAVETEASKANQQLDMMIEKLNKVNKSLSGIDLNKLRGVSDSVKSTGKSAQDSANRTRDYSSAISILSRNAGASNLQIKKLTSTLGGYITKSTLAKNRSKSLAQTFGSFYASFFPVIRGVKALGRSIKSSMDYIETFNYFNVTMDKIGKEFSDQYQKYGYENAEAYADSFSSRLNNLTKKMTGFEVSDNGVLNLTKNMNLGLDPNQIMNYQASIAAVTNSVGLCGETSVNTSKALSMLAADLSSFKNVDLQTVMTNMQSGLIGQSRALYKYGIDITNATLQTYAYRYGLSTAVSEMTQADKMQLRLLAILDQSKIAWGDQANTINSVANQYRILKQQIKNVARMVGNLLMPVIQAVLPFVNGLLIAVQRLLGFIGGLLGIDFGKIMDGISSGYSGIDTGGMVDDTDAMADNMGNVSDNLGKANKNAKKLHDSMLGIDELNVIRPDDSDASGSGGAGSAGSNIGGGAGGIDLSDEIGAAIAAYEAVWNEAFQKSVNKAQEYADKICSVFSNMWSLIKAGDYEGLGEYIAGGIDSVFEKINSVFNWDKMGPPITKFVDAYCRTINSLVDNVHWADIGKTIGDGLNVITNTLYLYLTGIDWINIGTAIANGLNGMVNSIDWDILGRTIGAWIMKIPNMIYGFVTTLDWSGLGTGIGNALNGALMEFDGKTIAGGINGIVNGILDALKAFIKTVDWSEVAKAVGDVLGNLDWGTLAKVGLTLGAVKLVSMFGGILQKEVAGFISGKLDGIFGKLVTGIGNKFGAAFKSLKPGGFIYEALGNLGMNLSIFVESLTGISIPVGAAMAGIVAGITIVIAGIVDLWNTSETFRDSVKDMWDKICEAFAYAKKRIWDDGLKPLWDSIKEFFGSLYGLYESSGLKDIFETIVVAIGDRIAGAFSTLVKTVGNIIGTIAGVIAGIIEILSGVIDFIAGVFSGDWEEAWTGVKKIVMGFVNTVVSLFTGVWEQIKIIFSPVVEWFKDTFSGAYEAIKSAFKFIASWFGEKWTAIKGVFDKDKVKNFFKSAFKAALDAVKNIWDGIGDYFKKIANHIISPIGKAVNGIIKGINWVLDKVGSRTRIDLWDVPKFAKGTGGLSKDTLGMVNDQKGSTYRELIVPPSGKAFIPKGRNVMLPLQRGTKIMPANQTKAFMDELPHFAGGIGDFFGNAWSKLKDFTGNVFDYITHPDKILQIAVDKFVDVAGVMEPMLSMAKGAVSTVFDGAVDFIKKIFDTTGVVNYNPSAGVEQWRGLAEKALRMTGQYSEANLQRLLYQMKTESGGNPRAINNWDINAKNGTPSKGLMQVIDPTFKTWAMPPYNKDIYDPLSNMLASIRYAVARYGSLAKAYSGHGYADGGFPKFGEYFFARENGPELVGRVGHRNAVVNNDQIVASISEGVESAIQRQNAETNYLLRRVVELEQALLDKDIGIKVDGKKMDKQLSRARKNTGFNFSPA